MNEMNLVAHPSEVPRPAVALNDGPDSLLLMLPPKVREMIERALKDRPELFDKSETELFSFLRLEQAQPTPSDNRLRMKFWMEYDRCRLSGSPRLIIDNVLAGVCYREYFYQIYLSNPMKLAWMVCMPTGYAMKTLETLEFGIDRMRAILDMDHMVNGKPMAAILNLKRQIVDMMHAWVKGAPVQRTLAVNVQATKHADTLATAHSMEELEKKLNELRRRNKSAKNLPIDITPAEMDE